MEQDNLGVSSAISMLQNLLWKKNRRQRNERTVSGKADPSKPNLRREDGTDFPVKPDDVNPL